MEDKENVNWGQSVTGIVIQNNKVLLARHTYGNGKNMLIVPSKWRLKNTGYQIMK